MTDQQPDSEAATAIPSCPKCQGEMWDNRVGKKNPKTPDFKCKDKACDGVIWPPRDASRAAAPAGEAPAAGKAGGLTPEGLPLCPVCGGLMWDDRLTKRNPKAPDFKCRNKPKERGGPGCEGIIWPPRSGASPYPPPVPRGGAAAPSRVSGPPSDGAPPIDEAPPPDDDDLPF
jgi:hypothetical protein